MKKSLNIIMVLFLVSIFWLQHQEVLSQQTPARPDKREIILIEGDTLIRTYVMIGVSEIAIQNDLTYAWYRKNRIYVNQGGYSGKLLHGSYKKYFKGELFQQGNYEEGLKSGVWKCWYINSVLKSVENYKSGLKNGLFSYFDEGGELVKKIQYKNGLLDGDQMISQGDSIVFKKFKKGSEIFPKVKKNFPIKEKDTLIVK